MHVLVLGSEGMLGKEFLVYLQDRNHVVTGWGRTELDITNAEEVLEKIQVLRPRVIINCAAYTAVDTAESERALAFQINAQALSYIGTAAKAIDALVIHVSTDYVFSGTQPDGYEETETAYAPCNVYGESKLGGEQLLSESGCRYVIIRVSWLFGIYGKNFVGTMLSRAHDAEHLRVVNDQYGKPTYTYDVVRTVIEHFIERESPSGIYHLPNEGICTWYDFAVEIFRIAGVEKKVEPCSSTTFSRPAQRPTHSVLINTKLPPLRLWNDALRDYIRQLERPI